MIQTEAPMLEMLNIAFSESSMNNRITEVFTRSTNVSKKAVNMTSALESPVHQQLMIMSKK